MPVARGQQRRVVDGRRAKGGKPYHGEAQGVRGAEHRALGAGVERSPSIALTITNVHYTGHSSARPLDKA